MSTTPLPPKDTTSRELLSLARRIERYSVQRRKLLAKVDELDGQIREAKRMFRALTDLIAQPELPVDTLSVPCWCGFSKEAHQFGTLGVCTASAAVPS